MTAKVLPLNGKYYGTIVEFDDDTYVEIWRGFKDYTPEEVSVREKADGWNPSDNGYDHVEAQRDYETARLFAAAPELLEVLKKARDFVDSNSPSWYNPGQELLDEIHHAIIVAEGKQ